MTSSPQNAEASKPESGKSISTIDEEFYRAILNTYISDDDEDDDDSTLLSDGSSDTPVPFASASATDTETPSGIDEKETALKTTEDIPSNESETSSQDTLLISEKSNVSKDSASQRDNTGGSKNDLLLVSEKSYPSDKAASRLQASGYDSLMVSLSTDETFKKVAEYPDDDASSLSSPTSKPFPYITDDSTSQMAPSSPKEPTVTAHDAETANKRGRGSWLSESARQPLSERMAESVESPSLLFTPASSGSTAHDSPAPTATDILDYNDAVSEHSNDKEKSLKEQDVEADSISDTLGSGDSSPIYPNETEETKIENEIGQSEVNNQSEYLDISTIASLRVNDRGDQIPRRWIFDRVDGTVKVSDEEEGQLPLWKRKPLNFLCLPSPLLGLFPWWLEENPCCVTVGRWGFFGGNDTTRDDGPRKTSHGAEPPQNSNNGSTNDNQTPISQEKIDFRRKLVLVHALLLNACGLFATILSGLSLSRSSTSLLETAPFGKAMVVSSHSSSGPDSNDSRPVILYLGLLSLGVDNPNDSVERSVIVGSRDFCDTVGMEQFVAEGDCDSCGDASAWIVFGFFLATMAYLPLFAIGTGRLYKNYDMNCSKVASGLWSLVSLFGYFVVLSCYHVSCLGSLYEGEVFYTKGGAVYDGNLEIPQEDHLRTDYEWKIGVGQIFFLMGLVLKLIDFGCNCFIATPAITRSRELQWEYEEDLSLHGEKVEDGNIHEGSAVDQTVDESGVLTLGVLTSEGKSTELSGDFSRV